MTTAITRLITWLRGEAVGSDQFGNRYFQDRNSGNGQRRRRWVI
jgi:NADH:ubiquinone oxidoreductase subunit